MKTNLVGLFLAALFCSSQGDQRDLGEMWFEKIQTNPLMADDLPDEYELKDGYWLFLRKEDIEEPPFNVKPEPGLNYILCRGEMVGFGTVEGFGPVFNILILLDNENVDDYRIYKVHGMKFDTSAKFEGIVIRQDR